MHTCRLTQEAHDGRLGLLEREWAAEGGGIAGRLAVVGAVDLQRLFDTGSSFLFVSLIFFGTTYESTSAFLVLSGSELRAGVGAIAVE